MKMEDCTIWKLFLELGNIVSHYFLGGLLNSLSGRGKLTIFPGVES